MANTDYGAVLLTTCEATSQALNQKLGVSTGFAPSEWASAIASIPAGASISGVSILLWGEYISMTPVANVLYLVLDRVNVAGDGGGTGVYRYYFYFNGVCLNPNNASRASEYSDFYFENLIFNGGGSVFKSDDDIRPLSDDNISRNWTAVFKAHNWSSTSSPLFGMSRVNAPSWYLTSNGNNTYSRIYVKGDSQTTSQEVRIGNTQDKEIKVVKVNKEIKVYVENELTATLACDYTSTANSDWLRIGATTSGGTTFTGICNYVGFKWDS